MKKLVNYKTLHPMKIAIFPLKTLENLTLVLTHLWSICFHRDVFYVHYDPHVLPLKIVKNNCIWHWLECNHFVTDKTSCID